MTEGTQAGHRKKRYNAEQIFALLQPALAAAERNGEISDGSEGEVSAETIATSTGIELEHVEKAIELDGPATADRVGNVLVRALRRRGDEVVGLKF